MIKLTPLEVEACRELKQYTERALALELYEAIENDDTFMAHCREMCRFGLEQISQMLLGLLMADISKKDINEKLIAEAGPISLFYVLDRAKSKKDDKDDRFAEIAKKRKENIKGYTDRIKELEAEESKGNEGFNTLLYTIRNCIKKNENIPGNLGMYEFSAGGSDSEETKKAKETYNTCLQDLKGKNASEEHTTELKAAYFGVKKDLDRAINEQRHKIEWQHTYARSLEKQAISGYCQFLELSDISVLNQKIDEFSPSDCSDFFRLFGTVIEEIPSLLESAGKDFDIFGERAEDYKLWVALRQSYRETTGVSLEDLALHDDEEYVIDLDQTFVLFCEECSEVVEESAVKTQVFDTYNCMNCGEESIAYFEDARSERSQPGMMCECNAPESKNPEILPLPVLSKHDIKRTCSKCDGEVIDKINQELVCNGCDMKEMKYFLPHERIVEKSKLKCRDCDGVLEPKSIRPFWAGAGGFRARRRDDNWSAGAILKLNSVTRLIDRIFGLAEVMDISGTTADQIYGTELIMNLSYYGEKAFATEGNSLDLNSNQPKSSGGTWASRSQRYSSLLILLPMITMVRHGHHSILECALTYTLTGYIDAYHVGYYTTLLPKEASESSEIHRILKRWEDSPTNLRFVTELAGDGTVTGGWLYEPGEVKEQGDLTIHELCKVDYPRYVDVFKPLRDLHKDQHKVTHTRLGRHVRYGQLRRRVRALELALDKSLS